MCNKDQTESMEKLIVRSPSTIECDSIPLKSEEITYDTVTEPIKVPAETNYEEENYSVQSFLLLTFVMFFFFGAHNLLQEAITRVPGFKFTVMLGWMEVLGVSLCSYMERSCVRKERGRNAPLSAYPLLALCLMTSTALSNLSLKYINYPTKVVFRSCKLLPTMIFATCINKHRFSSAEYVCALAVCAGLVLFASAGWKVSPNFDPFGLILVMISVFGDAVLPNLQEKLFLQGSTRLEVTVYTNFFTCVAMTCTTYASGDLMGIINLAIQDHQLAMYMGIYIAISYVAISTFMIIIKRYGAVVGVLLGTARKAITLILSFLLFPKQFCWLYVLGAVLVLGGLLMSSLIKHKKKIVKVLSFNDLSELEGDVEKPSTKSNSKSNSYGR